VESLQSPCEERGSGKNALMLGKSDVTEVDLLKASTRTKKRALPIRIRGFLDIIGSSFIERESHNARKAAIL